MKAVGTGSWSRQIGLALVAASIGWPLLLAAAAWPDGSGRTRSWSPIVYLAASRVCHQKAERSFHSAGIQWPVCARCAGLYLAAPVGAVAAFALRRRPALGRPAALALLAAAAPSGASFVLEMATTVPVNNTVRAVAALPLGAAIAFVAVSVAGRPAGPIEYTRRAS